MKTLFIVAIVRNPLLRKILFAGTFFFCSAPAFAQYTYYSCDSREDCDWDSTSQQSINCQTQDLSSMFKLNATETMFEHTTPTLKSAYYVSTHEHDSANNVEVYTVTSDVGNKYTFVVDTARSEIRIVGRSATGTYIVRWHLKSTWSGE